MRKTSGVLLALYAILIAALLVLVVAGARLYGAALQAREQRDSQRLALAYIQSQTAGRETGVEIRELSCGQALSLAEGDDLVTLIYLYDGKLSTQLWRTARNFYPEAGDGLCDLNRLELSWEAPGLLKVTADDNVGYARCGGGGHG
jgi:hypothetical protein